MSKERKERKTEFNPEHTLLGYRISVENIPKVIGNKRAHNSIEHSGKQYF